MVCLGNMCVDTLLKRDNDDNNNNNIYYLQLGSYPVAVVILRVHKYEKKKKELRNLSREGYMRSM